MLSNIYIDLTVSQFSHQEMGQFVKCIFVNREMKKSKILGVKSDFSELKVVLVVRHDFGVSEIELYSQYSP